MAAQAAGAEAAGQVGAGIVTNFLDKVFPDSQKLALSKAQAAQAIQETANSKAQVEIEDRAQKDEAKLGQDALQQKKEDDARDGAREQQDQDIDNRRDDEQQEFENKIKEKEEEREDAKEDKEIAREDAKVCLLV
jgi:hypothetical protein